MSIYQFAAFPSNSSVASAVTLAVCAWFPVAGASMITERPAPQGSSASVAAPATVVYAAPAVAIPTEARLIIVVEGHRGFAATRPSGSATLRPPESAFRPRLLERPAGRP
ncbi:MAG: hypothetical protein ABIR98_14900 [Usitatibacter sp.]